jgi:hypothetical protein
MSKAGQKDTSTILPPGCHVLRLLRLWRMVAGRRRAKSNELSLDKKKHSSYTCKKRESKLPQLARGSSLTHIYQQYISSFYKIREGEGTVFTGQLELDGLAVAVAVAVEADAGGPRTVDPAGAISKPFEIKGFWSFIGDRV